MRDRGAEGAPLEGYLTDGTRLLFAERVAHRGGEPVVVLEDCRTLEVIVCAIHDFRGLRLRPVARERFAR
ncbi:MAG: hypothetical protein ACJ77Z_11500 [Thermoleophilaceae bacterium]|jgi:hypothetical protein